MASNRRCPNPACWVPMNVEEHDVVLQYARCRTCGYRGRLWRFVFAYWEHREKR